MHKSIKVVIIHGSFGAPEGNWFPWLSEELRKEGYDVLVPRFPTPENQNLLCWQDTFSEEVGALDSNMILVGHSLGVGFILNLLESSAVPVLGTFLVSGFLGKLGLKEFDAVNESFVCKSFDWDKIYSNSGFKKVYNSNNDPYVPIQSGEEIAKKLDVELTVVKDAGHINADSGFLKFPTLLTDIREFVSISET